MKKGPVVDRGQCDGSALLGRGPEALILLSGSLRMPQRAWEGRDRAHQGTLNDAHAHVRRYYEADLCAGEARSTF